MREADVILQNEELGLKKKALTQNQFAKKFEEDVYSRIMHCVTRNLLDYKTHLACINGQLLDCAKTYRQQWEKVIFKKSLKCGDWHQVCFRDEVHFNYWLDRQLQVI